MPENNKRIIADSMNAFCEAYFKADEVLVDADATAEQRAEAAKALNDAHANMEIVLREEKVKVLKKKPAPKEVESEPKPSESQAADAPTTEPPAE